MNSEKKCKRLADEIRKILSRGLLISGDVAHFIDSTFSNPTIDELQTILSDDSNCEKDSLMELLFFPDQAMQIELESLLEELRLTRQAEDKVLENLCREPLQVDMRLPQGRGSLSLNLPNEIAPGFLARLHIHKHLDHNLQAVIDQHAVGSDASRFKVKIRNARFSPTEKKIQFLNVVFEKIGPQSQDFDVCLDFTLVLLDELDKDQDIYPALMAKKRFYLRSLQKAKKLADQLQKNNLETLLAQGKRVIVVDAADARQKMLIIDRISRAVFGKTEFFEDLNPTQNRIELHSDQDIQDIINKLS